MTSKPPERRATTRRQVVRVRDGSAAEPLDDEIAVEEPLEIRIAGDALATLMRTPGEDHFLTAGFLFSEGIIGGLADVGKVAHCGRPQDPGFGNIVDVSPGPGTSLAPELSTAQRRGVVSSACGVCGRQTIDDLLARTAPLRAGPLLPAAIVANSQKQLLTAQQAFGRTGAMHGALVLDATGQALACSEDVGRHNAVDKVVGKLLYAGLLAPSTERPGCVLAVSGRNCLEIVQKAALARLPVVISVGAPTSLAIDLAQALGVTLIGFARGASFNIYAQPERIAR